MRKRSAFILLLPAMILFVGTVRIGSICAIQPEAPCGNSVAAQFGKAVAERCRNTVAEGCGSAGRVCRGSCDCHQNKNQPKPKNACPNCPECPLCAPVTLSPVFRLDVLRQEKITEYAVMPDNPLSDYSEPHWKPPDPCLV